MEKDSFFTIKESCSGFYKEKGSKFYAFAFPAQNKEDVQKHLAGLKKEFHDARHFCYAYILGELGEESRANDDGEPSNSAGKPILGQLRAFDLTQTLVVVVRYFGGTKLGVGGLIQAYKESSKLALSEAQIIEKTITLPFSLHFGYPELNTVMRLIKDLPLENQNREFMEDCKLHFSIRKGEISTLEQRFTDIKNITLINQRKEKT